MCKCNPSIRTPFCGKMDCQWPDKNKQSQGGYMSDVNKLQQALDQSQKEIPESMALKMDDLKSQAEVYLNDKAKNILNNNRSNRLTKLRADAHGRGYVYSQCVYLGKRVKLENLDEAIKELAQVINKLADDGKIESSLSHFFKYDLMPTVTQADTLVLCYPLVYMEDYEEIMANPKTYLSFREGGVPE